MECCICHQTFSELNAGMKGERYCDECFNYKTCAACHTPINRNNKVFRTFKGQDYHVDCFVCCCCDSTLRPATCVEIEGKVTVTLD